VTAPTNRHARRLSLVALVSGVYDISVGVLLLFAAGRMAAWFGVPPSEPPIHVTLNGLFLLAIGAGYALPWRRPLEYRGYLWVMGPFLKGGGALAFVLDYLLRGSPRSFLLFAATDGALAVVTCWLLLAARRDT
jgi:hypothetical protein